MNGIHKRDGSKDKLSVAVYIDCYLITRELRHRRHVATVIAQQRIYLSKTGTSVQTKLATAIMYPVAISNDNETGAVCPAPATPFYSHRKTRIIAIMF